MKQKAFLFVLALLSSLMARAYDAQINGIYYDFDGTKATVTAGDMKYTGSVTISSTVTYNGVTYSVTSIGEYSFYGCSALTEVVIPNSVKEVGNGVFKRCSSLTSVTFGSGVTSIGKDLFDNCDNLTSISVERGNTIYDSRDNCNAIIETASNTLVLGCKNTVIPNSVTTIGESAFEECTVLTSITIPNGVTTIGLGAFCGCPGLTSVTLPKSVTSIKKEAFCECTNLKSMTILGNVTEVGAYAFCDCPSLTDVYFHAENIPITTTNAFDETPISSATLHVPAGSVNLYKSASPWSGFGSVVAIDGGEGDDPTPAVEFLGAKRIFADNLLKSSTYDDKTFTYHYDSRGFVTQIDRNSSGSTKTYTISYGDKITFNCSNGTKWVATLNSNGFVGSMVSYKANGAEDDHVVFTYNSDDQLTGVAYDDDEFYNITYSGGDIIQCNFSKASGSSESWTYSYGTSSQSMVPNTGNVMEFDNIYGVDLDDYNLLYYIGALGKATKHLPLTGLNIGSTTTATWVTDAAGRVTKGIIIDHTLTWNWDNEGSGEGGEQQESAVLTGSIIGQWNIVSNFYTRYENDVIVSQENETFTSPYDRIAFYDNGTVEYLEYSSSSNSYHEDGKGTYTIVDNKFVYGGGNWDNITITAFDGSNTMEVYCQLSENKGSKIVRKVNKSTLRRVTEGGEPSEKCATPTISFVNGKLEFSCETEGVEFVAKVTCPDAGEYEGSSIPLTSAYIVTVYAKKDGYENSDIATEQISLGGAAGVRGDVNLDNEVGMPDVMFIVNHILNGKFPDE